MSNIEEYTKNFKFIIPEFNVATWHTEIKENFKAIDALIANFVQSQQYKGAWKQVTQYEIGDLVYISDENSNNYGGLFKVLVDHITTADDFDTFLGDNPTYYDLQGEMGAQVAALRAQDWAEKTDGIVIINESPVDYSSKAYAIGGTGTETNNSKYFKEQAELARDGILLDPGFIAIKNDMLGDENIKTVADNILDVNSVSDNILNILLVYNNLSDINTCSSNINAILNAPTQANNAANSATQAANSAALAYQYGNDKINQTHITNCITHIPQDIKLELNNGTITLKAGSKVYVPNGDGVFDEITTSSDLTWTGGWGNQQFFVYVAPNNTLAIREVSITESGSSSSLTLQYRCWYDTTNNVIKFTDDYGSNWTSGYSLPLAVIWTDASSITAIDQVFNGFGYIGSTVFALPGVKGLIPNGRNADGTLKSIEFTVTSVKTFPAYVSDDAQRAVVFQLSGDDLIVPTFTGEYVTNPVWYCYEIKDIKPAIEPVHQLWLNTIENKYYAKNDIDSEFTQYPLICVGYLIANGSQIVNFQVNKKVFHALDWNDKGTISGWFAPGDFFVQLNIGATGSLYAAPANGWFILDANVQGANTFVMLSNQSKSYFKTFFWCNSGEQEAGIYIPAEKGDVIVLTYSTTINIQSYNIGFRFYYAKGEVNV